MKSVKSIVVVLLRMAIFFCLQQTAEAKRNVRCERKRLKPAALPSILPSDKVKAVLQQYSERIVPLNSENYMPSSYCGLTKKIDGAVISNSVTSQYAHTPCVMKFLSSESWSTTKRIQLSVKTLQLSCSSTLKIYDSSGTSGTPMATFTCHSNASEIPLYMTTRRYLSVRLDNQGDMNSKFKLVLTTFKRSSYCSEYRCFNGLCIDKDLRCDLVDHCGDNSDEKYCSTKRSYYFNTGSLAGVIVAILVLVFIVTLFIFIRRRRGMAARHHRSPVSMSYQAQAPPAGSYPVQPAVQPMGYAPPPPNAYGSATVPPYAPKYPPQQEYPPQPMPGYAPTPDPAFNYNAPPPGYYQATNSQPSYPPQ